MEKILIKRIKKPKWSFKNVDADGYKSLQNSIIKNGQTKAILVRQLKTKKKKKKKYEIIDGRNVFKILSHTDRDYVDCHVFRNVNKVQAMLLYLEHDFYFQRNFVEVAKAIKKICKKHPKSELAACTPYNYKEVEELLKLTKFNFKKFKPIKKVIQSNIFN